MESDRQRPARQVLLPHPARPSRAGARSRELGTAGRRHLPGGPARRGVSMPAWRWLYRLPLRLRSLFQRSRVEQDLDEELCFYVEQRTELEVARGFSPEEARRLALR